MSEKGGEPSAKKKDKSVHLQYRIQDGKIVRILPICERCGNGYFMGDHGDRYTCGRCGFTRYKSSKSK